MSHTKTAYRLRILTLFLALGTSLSLVLPSVAEARAGRGRSMGRPSGGSGFGYRRATPPSQPAQPYTNRPQYSQPSQGPSSQPSAPPAPSPASGRGSFFRGLAGGLAGGLIGSALFGSMGHASGMGGGYGGGGGLGIFELVLFAGLAYLGFRWWKKRQESQSSVSAPLATAWGDKGQQGKWDPPIDAPAQEAVRFPAFAPEASVQGIDKDIASDLFFRIQGAWTRRDLTAVTDILGPEMQTALNGDLKDLVSQGQINRLENISVRSVEVVRSWSEQGIEYSSVHFLASLLDYTVEEKSSRVIEGSDTNPVKFEEYWTFARSSSYAPWRVVGIEQS